MNRKLNETIVCGLIILSILAFMVGIVLLGVVAQKDDPLFDTILTYCLTLCVVPFISFQFFMRAGFYVTFFSKSSAFVKFLLYMFFFPLANIWFMVWLDIFWHFLPTQESPNEASKTLVIYATIFYFVIAGIGLLVRFIRRRNYYQRVLNP